MLEPKKTLQNKPIYDTEEFFNFNVIKLDANENSVGASPRVLKALKCAAAHKINFYPCYGELLAEFARVFNLEHTNFLPTNGCDEAINVIFSTYLEPGDNVVSFAPTFVMPKIYTEILGANFVNVDYLTKWEFDAKALIAAAISQNAKIIHLTSPNSPTGEVITYDDVEKILVNFPNTAVVLDNTYINFCGHNCDYTELIKKYDNLFITKSFSKDFALAGLRLGYVISNENNIKNLKKVISPYSVNNLAVLAGLEALRDKKHFAKMKKEILNCKKKLSKVLTRLGFKVYKSETNFILCDFGDKADFAYEKLQKNNIFVKRFKTPNVLENHFRITIPNKKDLKKLKAMLKPRPLLVFDLDGVVFDVTNSYRIAVEKTFEHFAHKKLVKGEIQAAKNLGGLNCDWDLTKYLLAQYGVDVDLADVTHVFQNYFLGADNEITPDGLINEEKLILDRKLLNKLSQKFDLCVFTGRPLEDANYSLAEFGIKEFFNIIITKDDLPADRQKPHPDGIHLIMQKSLYKKIYYFGDTADDIKSAAAVNSRNVIPIGVLPPQDKTLELTNAFKNAGAKKVLNDINEIRKAL